MQTGRTWRTKLPLAFVVAACLPFLPCMTYSDFFIDELFAVARNADARGETPIQELLKHDFWGNNMYDGSWTHKSYRPLTVLSFALQSRLSDFTDAPPAEPLRAFNVVLHIVNSLLVYAVLRAQKAPRHWACLAACLFASHPTHTENVVYLVGRADALATHFWLWALLAWTSGAAWGCPRPLTLVAAVVCAVAAGLCKETGFCVLAQLAVVELSGPRPVSGAAPLLAVFGGVLLGRSWITGGVAVKWSLVDVPVPRHEDAVVRFCSYAYLHAKYVQLMLFPRTLSFDYSYNSLPLLEATFADARMLAVLAAYLGIVAAVSGAIMARSRRGLLGLSNAVVAFVPASNLFFVVGTTIGERLLYPCNVGAAMLLSAAGGRDGGGTVVQRQPRPKGRPSEEAAPVTLAAKLVFVLGLLLLGHNAWSTTLRVRQWQSPSALFNADLASYPRNVKILHQVGTVFDMKDRQNEALAYFDAALAIYGDLGLTDLTAAEVLLESSRFSEALVHLERALAGSMHGVTRAHVYKPILDKGFALLGTYRFDEAVPFLRWGLELQGDQPYALNALGYSLMAQIKAQEAADALERGLYYSPNNPYLLNNLGIARLAMGQQLGAGLIAKAAQADPSPSPLFAQNQRILRNPKAGGVPMLGVFYSRLFL